MIILGIDPGTAMLGYGVVERMGARLRAVDYGVISTPSDLPLPERLAIIHAALTDVIALHRPSLMGVERVYFTKNVQTAFAVGQGVVLPRSPSGSRAREAMPTQLQAAASTAGREGTGAAMAGHPGPARFEPAMPRTLAIAIRVANREGLTGGPGLTLDRPAVAPGPAASRCPEKAVREALRPSSWPLQPGGANLPQEPRWLPTLA
jgi:crossover junction endodeoxyribonuclease RuvC